MSKLAGFFEEKLAEPKDLAVFKYQSLRDIGSGSDDVGQTIVSASYDTLRTSFRVDYSDYNNFVFFNSALDYFNISGEKIINDYPRNGTLSEYAHFMSGCDDYQKWLIENSWPATMGYNDGVYAYAYDPEGNLSPGTSSFTIELLLSQSIIHSGTIVQKDGVGGAAYSVHCTTDGTSSSIVFYVSGATGDASVSYDLLTINGLVSSKSYFSFVCDRDADEIRIIHCPDVDGLYENAYVNGYLNNYTTATMVVASASVSGIGSIVATSGSGTVLRISSGSRGLYDYPITNVSYWSKARTLAEIDASYASNIRAQDDLVTLYRFNEVVQNRSGSFIVSNDAGDDFSLTMLTSSHVSIFSGTFGTSAVPMLSMSSNHPEPMTSFGQVLALSNSLENYVVTTQASASLYDKYNTNIVTNFVPQAYIELEEGVGTDVLKKFLYIIARQFDQVKVAIDQFVNWNKASYTGVNDTPDALLKEAAQYYGWDFVGNFLNQDAMKYFFGKGVVPGTDMEVKMYQIKNEFWRRTLNELMHIYKTKGTRESVESLLRVYGLDNKIIKLKEFGVKPVGSIKTTRINSHKSLPALRIKSGTNDQVNSTPMVGVNGFQLSLHAKFLPFSNAGQLRGTIFSAGPFELRYSGSAGDVTASIAVVNKAIGVTGSVLSAPLMDGNWWSVFVSYPPNYDSPRFVSGVAQSITVQRCDVDEIVESYTFSGTYDLTNSFTDSLISSSFSASIGHTANTGGTFFINEVKLYKEYNFSQTEKDAQTLDFQSYGVLDVDDLTGSLIMHWRLDDNIVVPTEISATNIEVYDSSGYSNFGYINMTNDTTLPFAPFERFLFDYNFIAPIEYGWNEEKIRIMSGSKIDRGDAFNETNAVSLELNIVDALNEDISKMLATVDNWNNVIGIPANRYRDSYPDLQKYRTLYFNKLYDRVNFRKFVDIMEFFDRSFVKMVRNLIPARAVFYGEEFVVESHMLERPKVQWVYRRYNPELVPEGIIRMVDHSGSDTTTGAAMRTYG